MNNVPSPDNSDSGIEREILAKGLTAPRVTPADIAANIASESYFTAEQGALAGCATTVTNGEGVNYGAMGLLTICVLVLKNGFVVTGESACASPANFNADIGRRIARENAIQRVWPLMGYELKERLYQRTQPAQAPSEV